MQTLIELIEKAMSCEQLEIIQITIYCLEEICVEKFEMMSRYGQKVFQTVENCI